MKKVDTKVDETKEVKTDATTGTGETATAEGTQAGDVKLEGDNPQDNTTAGEPEGTATHTPQAPETTVIETVDFKFNKNVKLDSVLIKAGETVEVTIEEAEEFTKAKHGEIVKAEK